MMQHMTIDEIVADIAEAAKDADTPVELERRLNAFIDSYPVEVRYMRQHFLLNAMESLQHFEDQGETDQEVILRVIAHELSYVAALLVMGMYRKLGKPASAGRYAIVAHTLFRQASEIERVSVEELGL